MDTDLCYRKCVPPRFQWAMHQSLVLSFHQYVPDSKVHGANMGPIWGQQDPGGPHVGPMNFAIWGAISVPHSDIKHKRVFTFLNELQHTIS